MVLLIYNMVVVGLETVEVPPIQNPSLLDPFDLRSYHNSLLLILLLSLLLFFIIITIISSILFIISTGVIIFSTELLIILIQNKDCLCKQHQKIFPKPSLSPWTSLMIKISIWPSLIIHLFHSLLLLSSIWQPPTRLPLLLLMNTLLQILEWWK